MFAFDVGKRREPPLTSILRDGQQTTTRSACSHVQQVWPNEELNGSGEWFSSTSVQELAM